MYKLKNESSLYDKNKLLTEDQFELIPEHHKLLFEKVNKFGGELYGNPFEDDIKINYEKYLETVAEITKKVKDIRQQPKTPVESYGITFVDNEKSDKPFIKTTLSTEIMSDYLTQGYIYGSDGNSSKSKPVQPMSSTTPESIDPFPYETEENIDYEVDIESGDDFYWDEPYYEDYNEE